MPRSLHSKMVMILVLLILSLMTVVGAFLLNSVEAFYLNDFYTRIALQFSDSEMVSDLRTETGPEENGAEMMERVLSAYSGELGVDGVNRQLYILDDAGTYLTGGDPFILSADQLLALAKLIRQYLPQVQTLACYCSIRDLMGKTDAELRALRAAGYNHLFVGLETGYPPAVEMINKGHTLEEAHLHLERILDAGFDYAALLMGGIAGRGKGIENARATAALINAHKPCEVSWISTSVNPGTELEHLRDAGAYVSPTERELLEEEIAFLEALDMEDDCWFFGTHPQNAVAVEGFFRDKAEMIAAICTELAEIGDDILDSVLKRGSM